jgi:hypothetical protein
MDSANAINWGLAGVLSSLFRRLPPLTLLLLLLLL